MKKSKLLVVLHTIAAFIICSSGCAKESPDVKSVKFFLTGAVSGELEPCG